MTAPARARRWGQQLGPYQSLAVLVVPAILVEPLKIVGVCVAGEGHWLSGTGMVLGAYTASLVFIERLFKVLKPKLLMLGWFSKSWFWIAAQRAKIEAWVRRPAAQRRSQCRKSKSRLM